MSTQAILDLLYLARNGITPTDAQLEAAVGAVKAIETAAKAFCEDLDPRVMSHAPAALHDAFDTPTDIAKEAP